MPFLIDGHNLIGQTPGLRLDDPEDERKLVNLLRRYLARVNKKGTVVFDRGTGDTPLKLSSGRLEVVFASPGKTADEVIGKLLQAERNPRGLTVVTSDQTVKRIAQRAGATVVSAAAFARQMLAPPATPRQKEAGLTPAEVAEWGEEFKRRR